MHISHWSVEPSLPPKVQRQQHTASPGTQLQGSDCRCAPYPPACPLQSSRITLAMAYYVSGGEGGWWNGVYIKSNQARACIFASSCRMHNLWPTRLPNARPSSNLQNVCQRTCAHAFIPCLQRVRQRTGLLFTPRSPHFLRLEAVVQLWQRGCWLCTRPTCVDVCVCVCVCVIKREVESTHYLPHPLPGHEPRGEMTVINAVAVRSLWPHSRFG